MNFVELFFNVSKRLSDCSQNAPMANLLRDIVADYLSLCAIMVIHEDNTYDFVDDYERVAVNFIDKSGLVIIQEPIKISKQVRITLGNDSICAISKNAYFQNLTVSLKGQGSTFFCGEDVEIRSGNISSNCEPGMEIIIGTDSRISTHLCARTDDGHTIIDISNPHKAINKPAFGIHIGKHVWIGQEVMILKDVVIPDGCIVATRSLVTKRNFKQNSLLAGAPAKIIKSNVTWDKRQIHRFEKDQNI